MAGISSDHILAAIMTPAANPRRIFWKSVDGWVRKKNTKAAPSAVIPAVNKVPVRAYGMAESTAKSFLNRRGARVRPMPVGTIQTMPLRGIG
jgi:hypothetical protein